VDFFAFKSGLRALIAVAGVPFIYGNLSATLGKTSLKTAMVYARRLFLHYLETFAPGRDIAMPGRDVKAREYSW
jgi:hypothetical protein